ncbi:MAG: hypothetical protein WBG86_16780 [Polyangiales bacterium]
MIIRVARQIRAPVRAFGIACAIVAGCSNTVTGDELAPGGEQAGGTASPPEDPASPGGSADIVAVRTSGSPGAYFFAVTVESPDTGCDLYADWWEIITPDGELLYRRVLAHSHVNEQPFTRSGGPVDVQDAARVLVRAHMSQGQYGGVAFSGSVASGFVADPAITTDLAPELADELPQPDGCAF